MSYKDIYKKLSNGEIVILDGGIGGELERIGAKMDKDLWCGRCSVENPDLVRQVHESYILAGADVITTNTYSTSPTAMNEIGLANLIIKWNMQGVKLAKEIANTSKRDIVVAGSVSTYGCWYKFGVDALKPAFKQQINILSDAGVDLIILETLGSELDIVEELLEITLKINLPVWLSISCAIDKKNDKLMHGSQESIDHDTDTLLFEPFDKVVNNLSNKHDGPILIMHSDLKITKEAVRQINENHKGIVGAYPNAGYWEKPNWNFVDQISTQNYLQEAKSWIKNGAQIIGGCCGVGPEQIKAISTLK